MILSFWIDFYYYLDGIMVESSNSRSTHTVDDTIRTYLLFHIPETAGVTIKLNLYLTYHFPFTWNASNLSRSCNPGGKIFPLLSLSLKFLASKIEKP